MAAETIKEFLISLGFNVDENSSKKFHSVIDDSAKSLLKFGAEVIGATTAIETMVEIVARRMQDLYYAAQRTGDSAQFLTSVGFAARKLGLDASVGTDMLEGMSRALRERPGTAQLIASLAGTGGLKEVNGQLSVTRAGLSSVLENLAQMPFYMANIRAAQIGLPTGDALYQILRNRTTFLASLTQSDEMAKTFGLDLDQATKQGKEFSQSVTAMTQALTILGYRTFQDLEPPMNAVVTTLTSLIMSFGRVSNNLKGLPADITAVTVALGGVAAALRILSKIPGFAWLASISGGITTAGAVAAGVGGVPLAGAASAAETFKELQEGAPVLYTDPYSGIVVPGDVPDKTKSQTSTRWRRDAVIDFFMKRGWSREQATGIAANLSTESAGTFSPGTVGDNGAAFGVAQWHKSRQEDFARWAGHDIHQSTLAEQLAFIQHELQSNPNYGAAALSRATSASEAARAFSRYYERPAGGYVEAERRGRLAASISIQQKTDIHLNGVRDPKTAADLVARKQAGVNDAMAQNFAEAIR